MSTNALDRRLGKVEARRPPEVAVFLAWGHTAEEARRVAERAVQTGRAKRPDEAVALVWPDPEPIPLPRRVVLDGRSEPAIGDRELELLCALYREEVGNREREVAIANGEDITGLDLTDFYIRHLRRTSKDLTSDLRSLAIRENPGPEIHWPERGGDGRYVPCECARCQAGETTLMGAHEAHTAKQRAWVARYLPHDVLFN